MGLFDSIPSLMYHHVNPQEESSTSITPENFETQIKYLAESGYRSVHIDEFFKFMDKWNIPEKVVLITFDDGYADNFKYAFPILKKYNVKATIFPVTSFIKEKAPLDRPQVLNSEILIESIRAKNGHDGYLTWDEIRQMMATGLIDIQAHCHKHDASFEDNKILKFYDGSFNPKLGWATDGDLRLGLPIYLTGPSLCVRRFYDDKGLRDKLASYVESNGGRDFFYRGNYAELLTNIVDAYGERYERFETEAESEKRIIEELLHTKELIEHHLNKYVNHICWPWGSVDAKLIQRAKKIGYKGGIGMKGGANAHLTNRMNTHRFNPCKKDLSGLKQKLCKHSKLFYSLYNDKNIDNLLIPTSKFK